MNFDPNFEGTAQVFGAKFISSSGTFNPKFNKDPNASGPPGENGATFYPQVSEDGTLSWSNDKGLDNPEPINIKGQAGKDGKDGYTPVKGVDYFDGQSGKDGYTPVKGVDYFDGQDGQPGKDGATGKDGKDGYTPVKGVDYFDGKDGQPGKDGKTPVKGTDYFTETDKAEMVSAVIAALPVYGGETE